MEQIFKANAHILKLFQYKYIYIYIYIKNILIEPHNYSFVALLFSALLDNLALNIQ